MTRLLLLLPLLVGAMCAAQPSSSDVFIDAEALRHNGIETLIIQALETFRSIMKTGSAAYNIPQLDPFFIKEEKVDLQLKEMTLKGSVQDLLIPGLSEFKLEDLSLEIADGRAAINVSLPGVSATGQYDLKGSIKIGKLSVPLEGNGDLTADLKDIVLAMKVDLGISKLGQIILDDFSFFYNMSDVQIQLGGLYDGSPLGKMINEILADSLTRLVTKIYRDQITTLVVKLAKEEGAAYLMGLHKDHESPDARRVAREALGEKAMEASRRRLGSVLSLLLPADKYVEIPDPDVHMKLPGGRQSTFDEFVGGAPIQLTGETRFYPHGALSTAEDAVLTVEKQPVDDSRHRLERVLSLLRSADRDVAIRGSKAEQDIQVKLSEARPRMLSTVDEVLGGAQIQLTGEMHFYPHGALSTAWDGGEQEEVQDSDEPDDDKSEDSGKDDEEHENEIDYDEESLRLNNGDQNAYQLISSYT